MDLYVCSHKPCLARWRCWPHHSICRSLKRMVICAHWLSGLQVLQRVEDISKEESPLCMTFCKYWVAFWVRNKSKFHNPPKQCILQISDFLTPAVQTFLCLLSHITVHTAPYLLSLRQLGMSSVPAKVVSIVPHGLSRGWQHFFRVFQLYDLSEWAIRSGFEFAVNWHVPQTFWRA